MKKTITALLPLALTLSLLAGCAAGGFDKGKSIALFTREGGSGTRGAFIELFGIEVKNSDGTKKDTTTKEAVEVSQTGVMLTSVSNGQYAVGYVSLGSLNDTVRAVQIDGVDATVANVESNAYPIWRPFNLATKGTPSALAADFIDYILSAEGQAVVVAKDCIAAVKTAPAYAGSRPSGSIVVAGSSSVAPVMEKLIEAYKAVNPAAVIELQASDSSAGMNAAIDGVCDIGMASRDLKDSELEVLTPVTIALDGIAVIVHKDNPVKSLTKAQVKAIYTGETLKWSEVLP